MQDLYKRLSWEWGSKARKWMSRDKKATFRASVAREPTWPEVHPYEIEEILEDAAFWDAFLRCETCRYRDCIC